MRIFVLAFFLGNVFLQTYIHLPSLKILWGLLPLSLFCFWQRKFVWVLAFAFGFSYTLWYAQTELAARLPDAMQGKNSVLHGTIVSLPDTTVQGTQFVFLTSLCGHKTKINLNWRTNENVIVGDEWDLTARLKRPHGNSNPGGFDYEAWSLQAGISANGYVVDKELHHRIQRAWYFHPVDRLRALMKNKIGTVLPVTATSPWITALVIGERNDIASSAWTVLRNTGTNHLMAIAGLHIGLMAAVTHTLVARAWALSTRLPLLYPATSAGAIASLVIAIIYSALAGFSLPTQRACCMLFFFILTHVMRRQMPAWHAWCAALFCILLMNPLSSLTPSFWLSFGSVVLIIYGVSGRVLASGLWWKWGRIQWVIALGLLPLSLALFQQFSFTAFVANSIAIPVVGFVIVPLCFVGAWVLLFSTKVGGALLLLADTILRLVWQVLTWLAHFHHLVWYQSFPHVWMLIAALIAVVFLLFPIGMPGRYLGVLGLLPIILYKPPALAYGQANLHLLDVGQGLSAVVQTTHHVLVFDTGAKTSADHDMGDSVLVPFLHTLAVKQVDTLVISHGDNDHSGGAASLIKQVHVKKILSSVPEMFHEALYCLRGDKWMWDGVSFEFLYPTQEMLGLNNDSSCVLKVSTRDKSILLPGDIEKFAEMNLVEDDVARLHSTILISPHHGSKTSAEKGFMKAVHPEYGLFSVGFRNRYHFPHAVVVGLYDANHIKHYETEATGEIEFDLLDKGMLGPWLYREKVRHYWNFDQLT